MKLFKDKVVVITGAGSGIGRALAIEFSKLGAILALNDFNADTLNETKNIINPVGVKIYTEAFDVGDATAMFEFANNVKASLGAADIIINNAGVAIKGQALLNMVLEEMKWLTNINYWGVVNGSKAFLPQLLEKSEAAIVNISSVIGLVGFLHSTAYSASKFAVRGFSESLMLELTDTSVSVHCVHPGGIKTNIVKAAKVRSGGDAISKDSEFENKYLTCSPEKAAKVIINGIKKKKFRILIGKEAYAMELGSRLAPIWFTHFIRKYF